MELLFSLVGSERERDGVVKNRGECMYYDESHQAS